ncbi:hypothetical protein EDC15_1271, partial [Acetobacter aceti NBRC 14818]
RDLVIERPNQVWCSDITYIPMKRGFLYLVAIIAISIIKLPRPELFCHIPGFHGIM